MVLAGGGALLGLALAAVAGSSDASPEDTIARRKFLRLVGTGSFVVMVTAAGVSVVSGKDKKPSEETDQEEVIRAAGTSGPAASPLPSSSRRGFPPVPDTRAELTKNRDFYRIDINLKPPVVDGKKWRLKVEGLGRASPVLVPRRYPREAPADPGPDAVVHLQSRRRGPHQHELLTGTPFKGILDEAGLKKGVREIFIESTDGFYESVP